MTDGYEDFHYTSQDGLRLHARVYGRTNGALPVVCLPGLTRNARDFHELALLLSRDPARPRSVVVFDYRGRGESAWAPDWKTYDPVVETGDVLAGLAALDIAQAAFIGTSRGGLIIMILAAMRPAVLRAAILNDVGPRIEAEGLAQIRAYLTRMPKPADWSEAAAIVKAANNEAFTALTDADWQRMTRAIYTEKGGRPVPDFDPALTKTVAAVDLSQPLPELWPQFEGLGEIPVMAIRGANSRLLSAVTLDEMAQRHPRFTSVVVDGQGHAPLLETGDLPAKIAAFLATIG